jgi:DnaJ-class molecular chaperone
MAANTEGDRPTKPCEKCGGTGEMDPPRKLREIYSSMRFVCDRCAGAKTEPRPG